MSSLKTGFKLYLGWLAGQAAAGLLFLAAIVGVLLLITLLAGCGAYDHKDCYAYGQDCPRGPQGAPGSGGETVVGPAGQRGETGAAGSDGKSITGPRGEVGATGPIGPSGESIVGPAGADGSTEVTPCAAPAAHGPDCQKCHHKEKNKP